MFNILQNILQQYLKQQKNTCPILKYILVNTNIYILNKQFEQ